MKIAKFACIAVAAAAIATGADAATFHYSYQFNSGDLLMGTLEGTVQGDGNTIIVSAVGLPTISGNPFPAGSDDLISDDGNVMGSALVTFDGSLMDFGVVNSSLGNGFNLHSDPGVPVNFAGFALPAGFASVLFHGEAFNPEAWSIAQIPLPASLPLLLSGIAGLFVTRRRAA